MSNFEMEGQCIKNAVSQNPNRPPSTAVCNVRSGKYTLKKKDDNSCVCKKGHEKLNSKCQGSSLH